MYAKVKDGVLQYAPLNYLTDDNTMIFNFNKNVEAMIANGFKEVINIVPSYDATKQIVRQDGFTETEDSITINYVVEENPAFKEEQFDMQKNLALSFLAETLTDEQALQVPMLFEEFDGNGVAYAVGKKVMYNGVLYKVIQAHTSQPDWTPDVAPSLFAKVINETPSGDIPEWEQPSSTNPYMTGDKVKFNGKIYESIIDNNTWSPTDYPAGWKEITEEQEQINNEEV